MKNLFLFLIFVLIILSCEKEQWPLEEYKINPISEISSLHNPSKVAVCHKGNPISVDNSAIQAHIAHGDAVDLDGDGFYNQECDCGTEVDCDDSDPAVHPNAEEILCNGVDDDCNPETPDQIEEICGNGIDDDCDGDVDEEDRDCAICQDGIRVETWGTPYYVIFTKTQSLYSHAEAVKACEDLVTENGFDDWTLLDRALVGAYDYHQNVAPIPGVQPGYYWIGAQLFSWMYIHNVNASGNQGTSVRPAGRQYLCGCERKG